MHGEQETRHGIPEGGQNRDDERAAGPAAQRRETGEDRPRSVRRDDHSPGPRAAEVVTRQDRAEQQVRRPGDEIEEGELHGRHPQPGLGPEFSPALPRIPQQRPAGRAAGVPPSSSTAKVTATADIEVPSSELTYPMQNRRKLRPRNTVTRRARVLAALLDREQAGRRLAAALADRGATTDVRTVTRPLDPVGQGWTLSQLRQAGLGARGQAG